MKKKLAIVTSHPIQYNAPWFKLLARSEKVAPRVFYTWEQSAGGAKYDPEFGREIKWDIPLLEGYDHVFVKNIATDPGTHHFKGLVNPTLNREIEEWKPDAVLVFGWNFSSHLGCLRHFHGRAPVFFRGDSTLLNETGGIKKLLRTVFLRWVYHYVDVALYVGQHSKDYFLRHGLREHQLVYAPHAIDNQRFATPEEEYHSRAMKWREELGIRENDLVVLFAGKLEHQKNPYFLVEMMKGMEGDGIKIVIVGNGAMEKEIKQAAGGDGRILFLDFQNQQIMPVVYRLGDIFILPSVSETWGLGANEAMASGCVVMMSDRTGGAIDLIREGIGGNGMIFGAADQEKCRGLLRELYGNREKLAAMKAASREMIRHFSFEKIVNAVEAAMTGTV